MEYPGSWDLLTASLAVCDLGQSDVAWAFLARHELVRNGPGDLETFIGLVRQEIDRGPLTGPSVARRVANALIRAGIALPAGEAPDPWAKTAEARLKDIATMVIDVIEEPVAALAEYGRIPIVFEVSEVFDVVAEADGGTRLEARRVPSPYLKDYDAIGDSPMQWAERFDLSNWGFFSASSGAQCVGRAAVARDTPALEMLEGRRDLALLWDIRVAPLARRQGVGSALFDGVVTWARSRGCLELRIETQNTNVAACRFYAQKDCVLRTVQRGAYPELPDEVQLLWTKDLVHI